MDKERLKLFAVGGENYGESGGEESLGDPRQVEYETHGADANLEVRFPAKAGPHVVGASFFVAEDPEPEGVIRGRSRIEGLGRRGGKNSEPGVGSITVSGPYSAKSMGETPSRQKIFICRPAANDEETCARRILSTISSV